jgi:osmotically-inducible protein OsmY
VESNLKKLAAEEAANRVRGVKAVANDVEVCLPISAECTDVDIAAAALHALQACALLPAERLEMSVSEGWVTLKGEVEWYFHKEGAERVVRRLAGVKGVINLITVRPQIKPSPEELKRRIEEALVRNAQTDVEAITVSVDGETVILRGTARSWAERERAEVVTRLTYARSYRG